MSRSESRFRRWFRRGSIRKPARSHSYKPALELLEYRALPSTIVVTNLLNSGDGSLRAAITQANTQAGDDAIAFAAGLNGNLNLRSALPDLSSNIHIIDFKDPGDAGVTVRRGVDSIDFRIFTITSGNVVAISGLTISNGSADFGGGIFNDGSLTLTNCTVSGNFAGSGGGGIFTSFPMALTNCTVSGNSSYEDGGGILNTSLLTFTNSTVSGNFEAFGGDTSGGGIHNRNTGRLFLKNSTVSGNSAEQAGGIANHGLLTLTNSTVSDNFGFVVGGIFNAQFGTLAITNTTVSGNTVYYDSAAIGNLGELILNNSIVANSNGADIVSLDFGTITGSHNLIEDGSGGLADTISGDPKLGPLANNGGPTQTHALLFGSPAINAGSNALVPAGVTTDQRGPGFVRIKGGTVDIGAVERQFSLSPQAFLKGTTLFVRGDREGNLIAIADTLEGGISVTFDRGDAQIFTGVQRIDLITLEGNDEVTATIANPPDDFQFRADLGAGNDRLTISGFDPQPDPPLRRVSFDVRAGAGDDDVTFAWPPGPDFQFRADLGAGNDRLNISGFDPQPDPPRQTVRFDIDAGAGDDTVAFDLGHIHWRGQFLISADGGSGNDRLTFGAIIPCVLPESELRIGFVGGAGNDQLAVRLGEPSRDPAEIEGLVRFDLDGGAGDDQVKLDFGHIHYSGQVQIAANGGAGDDQLALEIEPCILPESELHVGFDGGAGDDQLVMRFHSPDDMRGEIDGHVRLNIHGGAGDDHVSLDLDDLDIRGEMLADVRGDAGADQFRMRVAHDVNVFGLLGVRALGGAGNDIMESFIQPCILPAGRGQFLFDGEAGNDRLAARFELGEHCEGALDVRVLGGLGDDDLTLALFDAEHLSFLTALVDGGRGHDVGRVTRNVRIVHCEEVFFLDDPR